MNGNINFYSFFFHYQLAAAPVCKDSLVNCDAYASECVNGKESMRTFLKTYCKQTCGYCGKSTRMGVLKFHVK